VHVLYDCSGAYIDSEELAALSSEGDSTTMGSRVAKLFTWRGALGAVQWVAQTVFYFVAGVCCDSLVGSGSCMVLPQLKACRPTYSQVCPVHHCCTTGLLMYLGVFVVFNMVRLAC
jgi:hypothetical protein